MEDCLLLEVSFLELLQALQLTGKCENKKLKLKDDINTIIIK